MRTFVGRLVGLGALVACGAEQKPLAPASTLDIRQVPPVASTAPEDRSTPEKRGTQDPECTPVTTTGTHPIGLLQGCVSCGGAVFVNMSSDEFGDLQRTTIIQRKCATGVDRSAQACKVIFDAIGLEIKRRAEASGLDVSGGIGIGKCATMPSYQLGTSDPQASRALQEITRETMTEWQIGGTIYVRVAPIPRVRLQ